MELNKRYMLPRDHTICVVIDLQTQLMSAMKEKIRESTENKITILPVYP